MSKKLVSLAISALDNFSRLKDLTELLEICIDLLEATDKASLRTELLIVSYLSQAELHSDELRTDLEAIKQLAIALKDANNFLL